jgi:hypothetical protein
MARLIPSADFSENFATFYLLGSEDSPVTLSTEYSDEATSDSIDLFGYKYIVFYLYCTEVSSAERMDLRLEVAEEKDSIYWSPLHTESLESGIATQDIYEIRKSITDAGLVLVASIPIRAIRYWRVKLKSDEGSPEIFVKYYKSRS